MTNVVGHTNANPDPAVHKPAAVVDVEKNRKLLQAYEQYVHKINQLKKQKFEIIVNFRKKLDEANISKNKSDFERKFK